MKKTLLLSALFLASSAAFSAPLTDVYTSSNGKVFSIKNVREVNLACPGYANLVYAQGDSNICYLQDTGNVTMAKIESRPDFVRVPGTDRYIRPSFARIITCNGTNTVLSWEGAPEYIPDAGCVLYSAIKSAAN